MASPSPLRRTATLAKFFALGIIRSQDSASVTVGQRLFAGVRDAPTRTTLMKAYKNCQSCGMPLERDEQGGGTDADGAKSIVYCSHCYQRGQFVLPDLTVAQMQARVSEKLGEFGIPRFLHGFFTRGIPKLVRWQPKGSAHESRN